MRFWAILLILVSSIVSASDSDRDGLSDEQELALGRDPNTADYVISSHYGHTCATDDSGLSCWGWNAHGQSNVPSDLTNVLLVAAGRYHTCAVDEAQSVRCWGDNSAGQLNVDIQFTNVRAIAAGGYHTCVIDDVGANCWGYNNSGQLSVPVLTSPIAIGAGLAHTCAIDSSGVSCWGDNAVGQLNVPAGLSNPRSLTVGKNHSCVIDDAGVQCWGQNMFGQINVPSVLQNPTFVEAGGIHTCAIDDNGLICWGGEADGSFQWPATLTNPALIQAGEFHNCALDTNGVSCWGSNQVGQINVPDLNYDADMDGTKNALDVFPFDPLEQQDSDGDEIGDNADAFPQDAAASLDSDKDGAPDSWNTNATEQQIVDSSLVLDALPNNPSEWVDADMDGVGANTDVNDNDPQSDTDNDGFTDTEERNAGTDPLDPLDYGVSNDDLQGVVYHWSHHGLMSNVEVSVSGATTATEITSTDGAYTFRSLPDSTYSVVAMREFLEAESPRSITSADALAALKLAVGLNPNQDPDGDGPLKPLDISPYQLIAADVNQDGRVTSSDSLAILKIAVGLSDALSPFWVFIDDSLPLWNSDNDRANVYDVETPYELAYPQKTRANFAAILVGDVNGSWALGGGMPSLAHEHFSNSARVSGAPLYLWGIRDTDQDGLSDEDEEAMGTSPFEADSDSDGINDLEDEYPLDASRYKIIKPTLSSAPIPSEFLKHTVLIQAPKVSELTSPVLLRGDMNDWQPRNLFKSLDDGTYKLSMELEPGSYAFKIASSDWAELDLGAADEATREIVTDIPVELFDFSNTPFVLTVSARNEFSFVIKKEKYGNYTLVVGAAGSDSHPNNSGLPYSLDSNRVERSSAKGM